MQPWKRYQDTDKLKLIQNLVSDLPETHVRESATEPNPAGLLGADLKFVIIKNQVLAIDKHAGIYMWTGST